MLSTLRKRVRVVMIVVAAAFIAGFLMSELWRMIGSRRPGRTQQDRGYVGKVGSHTISFEEYRNAVNYITQKYKTDNRIRDLSNEDYADIERQTWQFLVSELTWAKILKDANIRITQQEVFEIMKSNPPEALRNRPELMTEGKFDPEKYVNFMNATENRAFFQKYFSDLVEMLPKEKFRLDVLSSYRIPQGEIQDALAAANTHWKVTALYFGPRSLSEKVEPTDAEIRAFYDSHKEDYKQKETRQLRYVMVPVVTSPQDSAAAKETIDKAHAQLRSGESFNLTMLDYSELEADSLAPLIPRSQLDAKTDTVVRKLKPAQYSAPFLVSYGWQLVMLDSARNDSVAVRRILVRVKKGGEELGAVRDSLQAFIEQASKDSFDAVAARYGLQVTRGRPVVDGNVKALGLDIDSPSQLEEWVRTARAGEVMPAPLHSSRGYYVFYLAEVTPSALQDFEKIKASVAWRARQEQEKRLWLKQAEAALAVLRSGKTPEQYAAENPTVELQVEEYNGEVDTRRRKGPEFAGALLAMKPGQVHGVVEMSWGAFIIRVDEKTEMPLQTPDKYVEERRQAIATELLQEYLKEPEIRDYRDPFAY